MIDIFVIRAELWSPHDQGAELRKLQAEALAAVEKDKSSAGLFQGLFSRRVPKWGIRDTPDDILRCPDCLWEVIDGVCENCGVRVRDRDDDGDMSLSDLDDDDEDEDGFESDESTSSEDRDVYEDAFDYHGARFISNQLERRGRDERDNSPVVIEGNERSLSRQNDGGSDDGLEDNVHVPARRPPDRRSALNQRGFAFRVQISGSNGDMRSVSGPLDLTEEVRRDRARQRYNQRHGQVIDDSDEDDTEIDDDEDSLEGFIVNDDPPQRPPRGQSVSTVDTATSLTSATTLTTTSSDMSSSPMHGNNSTLSRRRRRIVIDDDDNDDDDDDDDGNNDDSDDGDEDDGDGDEDGGDDGDDDGGVEDLPNVSQANHNYFTGRVYTRRRGPIALSSDEDDEIDEVDYEVDSLLGYTPLDHDTEIDDYDDMPENVSIAGGFSPLSSPSGAHIHNRGVTFTVRSAEISENDRDDQGDNNMVNGIVEQSNSPILFSLAGNRRRRDSTPTTSSMTRRTRRSFEHRSGSTNTDTDDDDVPVTRRARQSSGGIGGSRRNYSGSHHESNSTRFHRQSGNQANSNRSENVNSSHHRARQTNNSLDRRGGLIPGVSQILRRHLQQRTENQFEHLARLSSSPARSVTPVPNSSNVAGNGGDGNGSGGNSGGVNVGRAGGGFSSFEQQPQGSRENSVDPASTICGIAAGGTEGRASSGATPVPIDRSGTGVGSISQYNISSPFPSSPILDIISRVPDPQAPQSGGQRSSPDREGQIQTQIYRTTAALATPLLSPRALAPRRDLSQILSATINNLVMNPNNPNISPHSPSSMVLPSPQQRPPQSPHHREHHRSPATLQSTATFSAQARNIGHRSSRSGLREAGSRRNLRPSTSRSAVRCITPRPTSPNCVHGSLATVASPLNPSRTGSGNIHIGGTPCTTGTSLVEEALANVSPRIPSMRSPRYTREEISRMGETMIRRRREELIQAQAQQGVTSGIGNSTPAGPRSISRPLASSHWRTLSAGDEPVQAVRRVNGWRDVGTAGSGSGPVGNHDSGSTTSANGGMNCGGVLQNGFVESPLSSPLSPLPPVTPLATRRDHPGSSSGTVNSLFSATDSPSLQPISLTGSGRSNSGPNTAGLGSRPGSGSGAAGGPNGGMGAVPRTPRLGVGIGTGGSGGAMWVIRGGMDPEPAPGET